ncbi:MAG TPA: 4-hydroxythreonine-4-phosphate dehydrogenase PdxA [Candidatus Polarisedimenticolia bacterium]|nr:4-hydroxythreonine-4-phosphate dehydrogenase PdxA [Candidatus Polarisedimenticolia bacterium]
MKPVIAISSGDPFGVGPEICLKAAASRRVTEACRPLLIGDRDHLIQVARNLPGGVGGDPTTWPEVSRSPFEEWGSKQGGDVNLGFWPSGPALHDMGDRPEPPGAPGPSAAGGRSAIMYVKQAVALVRTGAAAAVVTAPLSKEAMRLSGRDYPGHTELLADLCGLERDEVGMLFVAPDLKVALLTVHLGLKEAIACLSHDRIEAKLRLVRAEHQRWFGRDPRIALCALNPHAGEGGMFGREEIEILAPAVETASRSGLSVAGPFPADTLFVRAAKGEFDVVLALYHDQATIAVKARAFGSAVNMTIGLPFARTSVDHGTAFDIAGRGVADHGSLVEAILLAARLGAGDTSAP